MKRNFLVWVFIVFVVFGSGSYSPVFAEMPDIAGLAGLQLQGETGFMAIRVLVPENQALSEILWYNNDGQVVFPHLYVGTGFVQQPGSVGDAVLVGESISGETSTWSSFEFDQPVGATLSGLYVIFEFPNLPYIAEGNDGGAAIGYSASENGSVGWVSGDGEVWSSLHPDFGFSILPAFVPYTEGMAVKSLDGSSQAENSEDQVEKLYLSAGPNPFNPRTVIRFGLPAAERVRLELFDLRGCLVRSLADEVYPAGHHTVTWFGKDDKGGNAASAVYLVRILAGEQKLVKRLTLIR